MKKSNNNSDKENLRQKAEGLLKKKSLKSGSESSEVDAMKLIHELEVHQIELELINEELVYAKERADIATEKYVELYDFAPSGYFTLSRGGDILELNFSGANMLGKVRSNLKNNLFSYLIASESKQTFQLFIENIFTSEAKETCEVSIEGNDGSLLYLYLTGVITENEKECFVTAIDITKLKQIEEELIIAKERAEENTRLKSAFLANMSHEIRTPMNGILGFAELLEKTDLTSEEKQKYISIIMKSGERMLGIINDIISISKVESGQMEIFISETNINEQIEYIDTFFRSEVEKKGLQLLVKNTLSAETIIKTDREKIYAIMTNLVKNAIKFTDAGYIEFGCEIKGQFLKFFVEDTGSGIHQEQKQIIFERFRQGSELLTRNYEGSGLGLSISKAYVEMLGGKIWVESEYGKGSTFYFTIPYIAGTIAGIKDKTNNESVVAAIEVNDQIKDLKILIVEDNEVSEMLITLTVKDFCSAVLKAKTGLEAVNICRNNPDIDLVLMDLKMPEMDGIEATRQIRLLNNDVIIIAQSAFSIPEVRKKAIEAGCNDYISKPFTRKLLTGLLKKHFEKEMNQ